MPVAVALVRRRLTLPQIMGVLVALVFLIVSQTQQYLGPVAVAVRVRVHRQPVEAVAVVLVLKVQARQQAEQSIPAVAVEVTKTMPPPVLVAPA